MRRVRPLLAVAALLAGGSALPSGAGAEPSFTVRISPVANLVYHLDCLSGYRRCTADAFRRLWQRMEWSAEDRDRIERWARMQERYRIYADFADPAEPTPYPYTFPYLQSRGVDVGEKIRLASLQARDFADYASRLRLLMQPAHARETTAIVTAFRPRFEQWWLGRAQAELERLASGYSGTAGQTNLGTLLSRVGLLFDVDDTDVTELQVSLIALPHGARASQATVIENHAIVESRRGESPADRLGVIVHEFVHYLYSLSPPERHEELLRAFLDSERPYAMRSYNLINEAIASAIGNGILERRLQSAQDYARYEALPDSFYADFYVDTMAKALVPVINRRLAAGEPLDSSFAAEYLDTAAVALGERRNDVALQLLSSAIVATDGRLRELARRPAEQLTTFSLFTHVSETPELAGTALERYPELSGIVLLLSEDLDAIVGVLSAREREILRHLGERQNAFVFGQPRSAHSTLYLVVGDDVDAVGLALDHLLTRSRVFSGLSVPPRPD